MSNKRNKKIRQFKFYKSPVFVVLMFTILMAAFFIISYEASAQVKSAVTNGLSYASAMGLGTRDLRTIIFSIVNVILGFLAIVAVLIIMWGGFVWMTSKGDPNRVSDAKNILKNAVIGLVIIFLAFSIVQFIFSMFLGALFPPGSTMGPPPPGGCWNCSAMGGGIIESVYPALASRDVPRDTMIYVTFKELMQADTIIQGGNMRQGEDYVRIYYKDSAGNDIDLPGADVTASSGDDKTFTFRPVKYLGDGKSNRIYYVRLGKNILKNVDVDGVAGNDPAFPGLINYYSWWFEVGTRLDLVPPIILDKGVYPAPEISGDKDFYASQPAIASTETMTVKAVPNLPKTFIAATVQSPVENIVGSPTISGTVTVIQKFAGKSSAKICLTEAGGRFNISQKDENAGNCSAGPPPIPLDCLNNTAPLMPTVFIGCGLKIDFNELPIAGNQFIFKVTNEILADTLRVANTTYTFVSAAPLPNENKIQVGANADVTAANIRAKVNTNPENPDVKIDPLVVGSQVKFVSALGGIAGDSIQISASDNWSIPSGTFNLKNGKDPVIGRTIKGIPDESRDAILRIDFSEAMYPPKVAGTVVTDNSAKGVGNLAGGDFSTIRVYADLDNDYAAMGPEASEIVAGTWRLTNQYKTIEFMSSKSCGVCPDGTTPCIADADCGGQTCSSVKNSCGNIKKCLPVSGDSTHYVVRVDAAQLINTCNNDTDCKDERFKTCNMATNICQDAANINYPKAKDPIDGVTDSAANSLDGNRQNGAQGPFSFFIDVPSLIDNTKGDSYQWEFNINKTIDMTPPEINTRTPNQNDVIRLIDNPTAQFSKLMMMSSFLPDNSYSDGLCSCDPAIPANCKQGEYCDNTFKVCRRTDDVESFCGYDSQCNTKKCQNQEYVTLIDSLKNTGYYIGGVNVDIDGDGFFDQSRMILNHTIFTENNEYHVDVGSGLKDLHQNCFMPGKGPGCAPTSDLPYCCYGVAQVGPCTPSTKQ